MFARLALIFWFLHVSIGLNTSCCDSYHLKRQNGELWTCDNCPPGYHFVDDCEFNGGSAKCSPCSNGYYMETRNVFRACRKCKITCPYSTIIDFNCTSTSDLKCGCSYDRYLDKDLCVTKTKCQPGYGESGTTAEGDTKCVRCPEGTISPNNSSEEKCMPDTDDCALMPCMNNGTCTDLVNDFNCTCPGGISGRRCEHSTGCDTGPCQNGGRCVPEGILHLCDCPDGFKGKNCEVTIPSRSKHLIVSIVLGIILCASVLVNVGMLAWRLRRIWIPGRASKKEDSSGQESSSNGSHKKDDKLEDKDIASQSPGGQDSIRPERGSAVPDYEDGDNRSSSSHRQETSKNDNHIEGPPVQEQSPPSNVSPANASRPPTGTCDNDFQDIRDKANKGKSISKGSNQI
ncbi:delta-like protein 4 isoform X2 [Mya arenaria]|uniref:delta-like protein 4 isoform X2 n=1 Tax=Mya arenaria TaxID=6604 RepID=UPI0022E8D7D1|nr:delta-like protein 4 isoform X2 [Mya arenaria]